MTSSCSSVAVVMDEEAVGLELAGRAAAPPPLAIADEVEFGEIGPEGEGGMGAVDEGRGEGLEEADEDEEDLLASEVGLRMGEVLLEALGDFLIVGCCCCCGEGFEEGEGFFEFGLLLVLLLLLIIGFLEA